MTGRTSDTATAQMLRDEQEAQRQETGGQQATIKEIKTRLDAQRLLADLAVSHLLRPEDYVISQGADGGARIRHRGGHHGDAKDQKINYNVSDFLTKHMHLNWSEAKQYLDQSYERQKNGVPLQQVPSKARPDLWAEFKAEQIADAIAAPGKAKDDSVQVN